MKGFVSAETATKQSVEEALDAAFRSAGVTKLSKENAYSWGTDPRLRRRFGRDVFRKHYDNGLSAYAAAKRIGCTARSAYYWWKKFDAEASA